MTETMNFDGSASRQVLANVLHVRMFHVYHMAVAHNGLYPALLMWERKYVVKFYGR